VSGSGGRGASTRRATVGVLNDVGRKELEGRNICRNGLAAKGGGGAGT